MMMMVSSFANLASTACLQVEAKTGSWVSSSAPHIHPFMVHVLLSLVMMPSEYIPSFRFRFLFSA